MSLKKGVGSGSISQRYGSEDPDPHQNAIKSDLVENFHFKAKETDLVQNFP
jgi:hypothetical protein